MKASLTRVDPRHAHEDLVMGRSMFACLANPERSLQETISNSKEA
jgi:hypothetical protein